MNDETLTRSDEADVAARREAATILGSARSPAKAAASRANGQKGGRPKGTKHSPEARARISAAMKETWTRRKTGK